MFVTNDTAFIKCVDFLSSIGIAVSYSKLNDHTFLPGITIESGGIIIDNENFMYPGDVLHEAGHIAVVPAAERATLHANGLEKRVNREAEEMMAIAWSYAACVHLQIDPSFVFHNEGYKGGGSYITDNFREKRYFGLPMLQWTGMALDEKNAAQYGKPAYPVMLKWLRD